MKFSIVAVAILICIVAFTASLAEVDRRKGMLDCMMDVFNRRCRGAWAKRVGPIRMDGREVTTEIYFPPDPYYGIRKKPKKPRGRYEDRDPDDYEYEDGRSREDRRR